MQSYISRPLYINKIIPYTGKNIIKVLTGQRRVGKSYMIYQLIDYVRNKYQGAVIVYINKELHEYDHIRDYHDLIKHIDTYANNSPHPVFVFIDEIQDILDFQKALRSLQAKGGYDIYCTGSNANMLSGDLATMLSGRYIEFKIFSLSYPEFCRFHSVESSSLSLQRYLRHGGLPFLVHIEDDDMVVFDYLKNIYATILFKDVVARHEVRNVAFLERLVEFLANNTGSIVSAKKISDFLKSQKINISPNVVLNYLSYLTQAFFIFKVQRMEISGKKIFELGEKYYFEDLGLRHAIGGFNQPDINKIIENIVYLHLRMAGFDVWVGLLNPGEVDFVCRRHDQVLYIQAAYLIPDDKVRQREFGNLMAIEDNYQKIVVSMDPLAGGTVKGILHMHLSDFLYQVFEL